VEVFCERAYLALEGDFVGPVRCTRLGEEERVLEGEALLDELAAAGIALRNPDAAFIEAVQSGRDAYPSFADALRAHVLVDAIYRSAASGGATVTA
jgi:predicted dehydrogenase